VTNQSEIRELICQAAKQKILFLPHAVKQMSRTERMISTSEVRHVIEKGEVIEDYIQKMSEDIVVSFLVLVMRKDPFMLFVHQKKII